MNSEITDKLDAEVALHLSGAYVGDNTIPQLEVDIQKFFNQVEGMRGELLNSTDGRLNGMLRNVKQFENDAEAKAAHTQDFIASFQARRAEAKRKLAELVNETDVFAKQRKAETNNAADSVRGRVSDLSRLLIDVDSPTSLIQILATEARDLQLEHDKLAQRHASSKAAMEDAVQKFRELNATPQELNATGRQLNATPRELNASDCVESGIDEVSIRQAKR